MVMRVLGMRMRGLAGRRHRLLRIARLRPSAYLGADGIGLPGRVNVTTSVTTRSLAIPTSDFAKGDLASRFSVSPFRDAGALGRPGGAPYAFVAHADRWQLAFKSRSARSRVAEGFVGFFANQRLCGLAKPYMRHTGRRCGFR
jgi:hypothetical protein